MNQQSEGGNSALPILKYRKQFETLCKSPTHAVVLVCAETGSGKTTQLPQFLLDDLHAKKVCVTQPRRVAAITLAKRVSFERNESELLEVGYRVRFQNMTTANKTRLIFSTDGLLLREAMHDPSFSQYDFLVLDEVHERSLNTDLLFGVAKRALLSRNTEKKITLRVIVMSATVDISLFQQYFQSSVLLCEGRQHLVDVLYLKDAVLDRLHVAINCVMQIHREEGPGGILVFLSGKEEIETMVRALEKLENATVLALHAQLPHALQLRAFAPSKFGMRKIVCATNVAETSVTVPEIQFVVDLGVCKIKKTIKKQGGMQRLAEVGIAQSQAVQRAGRAGRERPGGKCFRLYPERVFEQMPLHMTPEIQRVDLAEICMQLLSLGVRDISSFEFLEKPDESALLSALTMLGQLGAVELQGKQLVLSEKGKKMSEFPVSPLYASLLLHSITTRCTRSMCAAIALEIDLPFFGSSAEAHQAKRKWLSPWGDHYTCVLVLLAFEKEGNRKRFCQENFLRFEVLHQALQAYAQLMALCVQYGGAANEDEEDPEKFLSTLVLGGGSTKLSRVAKRVEKSEYEVLNGTTGRVFLHPSSGLSQLNIRPEFILFDEILVTSKTYVRGVSALKEEFLMLGKAASSGGTSKTLSQEDKSRKRKERAWAIDE